MRRFSTSVAITDPFVKYQSLVATGVYSPDQAQLRLAKHLNKVYLRLKDYSPQIEYRQRLSQATRLTDQDAPKEAETGSGLLALKHHAIWRNPLFKHLLSSPEGRDGLALTKVLLGHERAIDIDSPKGLFLAGEVGTGKSMLLDLLADGLPTEKKRRWHFNTFMLYTLSQLDRHRKSAHASTGGVPEYSLLWMATKLIDESPILFLDEFQLPDRAASKILSHLFIAFFQLGGVLVASSNRMPEELQKATGVDYAPVPSQGLVRRVLGLGPRQRGELFGDTSDFANFLDVLRARCDFWQMEGAQDWRRREEIISNDAPSGLSDAVQLSGAVVGAGENSEERRRTKPVNYHLTTEDLAAWNDRVKTAVSWPSSDPVPWQSATLIVYGRKLTMPRQRDSSVLWDFRKLVESFGPADYITMASSYDTFIIENVPVLTVSQKNEARRFITLLDALYEAKCKLIIQAEATPDNLFFPETQPGTPGKPGAGGKGEDEDATYSETIAEVYQDQTSPFRPNVSYYDSPSTGSKYDPDQDSDFGLQKNQPDFGNATAFTGEDERFAYKRAISRLWELCGAQWHARTGDWWQPLPVEARHWEGGAVSQPVGRIEAKSARNSGEVVGDSIELEELAGLSRWRVEHLRGEDAKSESQR